MRIHFGYSKAFNYWVTQISTVISFHIETEAGLFMFGDVYNKPKFKISSWISSWLTSSARLASEGQLSEFIEGLGPGQLVGRQVLASPSLGEIQLSVCDRRGNLEVEVIRARGLQCKPGSKVLPGKSFWLHTIQTCRV